MNRLLFGLIGLLLSVPLMADIATNRDGTRAYLRGPFRMAGETNPASPVVEVRDQGNFGEIMRTWVPPRPGGNYPRLILGPDQQPLALPEALRAAEYVTASRNGEWVVARVAERSILWSVREDRTTELDGWVVGVTDSGDPVLVRGQRLQVGSRNLELPDFPSVAGSGPRGRYGCGAVDRTGQLVLLCEAINFSAISRTDSTTTWSLSRYNLGTGERNSITTWANWGDLLGWSEDGATALLATRWPPKPDLIEHSVIDVHRREPVFRFRGSRDAALSNDGQVVWAWTPNSLVKLRARSGETLTGYALPWDSQMSGTVAKGSYVALAKATGYNLFPEPRASSISMLVRTEGQDFSVPVFELPENRTAEELSTLAAQIPWELPRDEGTAELIVRDPKSPLEAFVRITYKREKPKYENRGVIASTRWTPVGGGGIAVDGWAYLVKAVKQDWSSLVTTRTPAEDGELLHLYMTGLGPVATPQVTGVPPTTSVPIINALICTAGTFPESSGQQRLKVEYAGLAPGLLGVYQVEVYAPIGIRGLASIECYLEGDAERQPGAIPMKL